ADGRRARRTRARLRDAPGAGPRSCPPHPGDRATGAARRPPSLARGLEPAGEALVQLERGRRVVETAAVAEREQALRLEHPVLEPERQAFAEIQEVAGHPRGIGLELVVPLGGEEHLVAAAQHAGTRE